MRINEFPLPDRIVLEYPSLNQTVQTRLAGIGITYFLLFSGDEEFTTLVALLLAGHHANVLPQVDLGLWYEP